MTDVLMQGHTCGCCMAVHFPGAPPATASPARMPHGILRQLCAPGSRLELACGTIPRPGIGCVRPWVRA